MLPKGEGDLEVVGHEVFFYTESDNLYLESTLTIRQTKNRTNFSQRAPFFPFRRQKIKY